MNQAEMIRKYHAMEEEVELAEKHYLELEAMYDEAVNMVSLLYATLHSYLPHNAERLLAENPKMKELL